MPDIRELTLLDQMDATRFLVSRSAARRARLRLWLRRLVVQTSVFPLSLLYRAIYRLHLRYALHVLRKLPGIHSIYMTGGLGSGEVVPGISDIDLAVNGEWTDDEQMLVANAMRRLSATSPLFDPQLGSSTHTLTALRSLYETDYFFQYRFNLGRTKWRRIYGQDLFALLPPVADEKLAGGYYSEVRVWWGQFVYSAFGFGVTATDNLFQTSIAYKSVAAVQRMELALRGENIDGSREQVLQHVLERDTALTESDRDFLRRLQRSASRRHLRFDSRMQAGDVQEESFRYLAPLMERIHRRLPETATFQPIAGSMHVDGTADEMLIAPGSRDHVAALLASVKAAWSGYRAAYLVPSLSSFYPDDLLLLIEVDPETLPAVKQIRELCRLYLDSAQSLRQRIMLFLLLHDGAYQLEILSSTELWRHTLCAAANPEVFSLIGRPEFAADPEPDTDGGLNTARRFPVEPMWTRFANDQLAEELSVRRTAFSKAAEGAASLNSLDLLRNLWRQVQLEIVSRSAASTTAAYGTDAPGMATPAQVMVPLTIDAMLRSLRSWGLPEDSVFNRLADAYRSEIAGTKVDVHAMLPEVMQMLALFQ